MSDRRSLAGASLVAETDESRDEDSRLKAGCSQDWLPHKAGRLSIATCGTLMVIAVTKFETIVSAANPLLKDVRRAIARGGLTQQGWCVAETFHLLEEALRSQCEVKMVLAAESARPAAEDHLRGFPAVKLAVL